jgi:ATPase family AAA domain-containing protein 3A/B
MFAMKLARQSGLDYAVLAGGDVAPLGAAAVTELHRVFDWGESRSKGLVLFVDEAEAFLRRRGTARQGEMSENMRNAISTFLYRTGAFTYTDDTRRLCVFFVICFFFGGGEQRLVEAVCHPSS